MKGSDRWLQFKLKRDKILTEYVRVKKMHGMKCKLRAMVYCANLIRKAFKLVLKVRIMRKERA